MPRYILTSANTGNEVDVTYDANGLLMAVKLIGTYSSEQMEKAWNHLPLYHRDMLTMLGTHRGITCREVVEDLSFDAFWKAYDHKFDRKRAEAIWKRMSDGQRMAAITAIADYDKYLGRTGIAKAYAKTWLLNESYLNDYKRLK